MLHCIYETQCHLFVVFLFLWSSDIHSSASPKGPGSIPLQDQHLALAILLELAVQRGTLRCGSGGQACMPGVVGLEYYYSSSCF